MRQDMITQAVPHADPEFIRSLERLPDPPPAAFEKVMRALPRLHDIFLRQRAAAVNGDKDAFLKLVDEQIAFIKAADLEA